MATIKSIQVSKAREVQWQGRTVSTGIFKEPVAGQVAVHRLGLAGDEQADLAVHGGLNKAVYSYALEHYDFWRAELSRDDLPNGMFGENLTTRGLDESTVNVGDRFRIGTALLEVTQPRQPCYKLGIRFGDMGIVKRFARAGRAGLYFRVLEEGVLQPGDAIEPT